MAALPQKSPPETAVAQTNVAQTGKKAGKRAAMSTPASGEIVAGAASKSSRPGKTAAATSSAVSQTSTPAKLQQPALFTNGRTNAVPIKAKRSRAPKNLAEQYVADAGRKRTKSRESAILEEAKRKRLDAKARELRQQVMTPSDDILRRLARVGAINATAANGEAPARPRAARGKKRQAGQWESRCGKCGQAERFSTPASLCSRCGTIMIRE